MDKQETIKEIRRYPYIYFDDLILALSEDIGEERVKRWVDLTLGDKNARRNHFRQNL